MNKEKIIETTEKSNPESINSQSANPESANSGL